GRSGRIQPTLGCGLVRTACGIDGIHAALHRGHEDGRSSCRVREGNRTAESGSVDDWQGELLDGRIVVGIAPPAAGCADDARARVIVAPARHVDAVDAAILCRDVKKVRAAYSLDEGRAKAK